MNIKNLLFGVITDKELLNYYNANVIIESTPKSVRGCVFNYDNVYFIIINKNLSYYKRKKTLLHELAHIELSQLCQINKDLFVFNIEGYEDDANEYLNNIEKEICDLELWNLVSQ